MAGRLHTAAFLSSTLMLSALVGSIAGCATREEKLAQQGPAATQGTIRPITYRRIENGAEDVITISESGKIQLTGRFKTTGERQLSGFEMMQLSRLFENWETLKHEYPPPHEAAPAPATTIQFGDFSVAASDISAETPEQFLAARLKIERLAGQIAGEVKR